MASLIKVNAKDNITGKDLLLFSNPNTTKGRNHITSRRVWTADLLGLRSIKSY